jgi:hypothetical protein
MATRKQASGRTKSTSTSKSAKTRAGTDKAAARSGQVPPYGTAIKEAIARGEIAGMRRVASSARKWLKDVQAELDKLDKAIEKKSRK